MAFGEAIRLLERIMPQGRVISQLTLSCDIGGDGDFPSLGINNEDQPEPSELSTRSPVD